MNKYLPLFLYLLVCNVAIAQVPVELFKQFNGKYNHVAIGNTLNLRDNSLPIASGFCDILPSSSATLSLQPNQNIVAAYLYWSGPIDTRAMPADQIDDQVTLNGVDFVADETFTYILGANHQYFASYVDVTDLAIATSSGLYELTNLDLSFLLTSPDYCSSNGGNQTNYGGWAISFIYEDLNLPYYQISLFHGLDGVSVLNNYIAIPLNNLNVIDDIGAQIHFLAWEGDENLANGETLFINGNQISNAPLNPGNNAFNGTNSYTNSADLNNMDLDFYDIQNNIAPGDTNALIEIRSLADLVMINNVVTVLNSQLPDATVIIDEIIHTCDNELLNVDYTIWNTNSTDFLAADTPISFYADGQLIDMSTTQNDIPIGGSESNTIQIVLPNSIPSNFTLTIVVDDDGTSTGTVIETDETNNVTNQMVSLLASPDLPNFPVLESCDDVLGVEQVFFDLTQQESLLSNNLTVVGYFESYTDAENELNPIQNPQDYENLTNPQTIYIRVENSNCYQILSFDLNVNKCPCDEIIVYSAISPNNDGLNDAFEIPCIVDFYENHTIKIYNRYGTLIFEGNRDTIWDGHSNRGLTNKGDLLPVATYYYVIDLKDKGQPELMTGWVYLNY